MEVEARVAAKAKDELVEAGAPIEPAHEEPCALPRGKHSAHPAPWSRTPFVPQKSNKSLTQFKEFSAARPGSASLSERGVGSLKSLESAKRKREEDEQRQAKSAGCRSERTSRSICSSISKVGNTANTALSTLSICSISTCKYLVFARKTEYLLSTCSVTVVRAEVFHFLTTLRLETGRSTRAALCPLVPSPPSRTIHTHRLCLYEHQTNDNRAAACTCATICARAPTTDLPASRMRRPTDAWPTVTWPAHGTSLRAHAAGGARQGAPYRPPILQMMAH